MNGKSVWAAAFKERTYIGAKPNANARAGNFEWAVRIGELMPDALDTWWSLKAADDLAPLAAEVVEAILAFALPTMRAKIAEAH